MFSACWFMGGIGATDIVPPWPSFPEQDAFVQGMFYEQDGIPQDGAEKHLNREKRTCDQDKSMLAQRAHTCVHRAGCDYNES